MTDPRSAASVHDTSWSETILRLHVGEHAPVGYEIKRVVGHVQEPSGIGGTSWRDVYVVACRKCAMSSHDSAAASGHGSDTKQRPVDSAASGSGRSSWD